MTCLLQCVTGEHKKSKILDWKKFADNKINGLKNFEFVLGRVENIVEKGENAGYQDILISSTMFSKKLFVQGR